MTIKEIRNEMLRLVKEEKDQEYDHKDADKLLIDLIEALKLTLVALGYENEVENVDSIIQHYDKLAK